MLRGRQCAWRFIDGRAVYVRYHLYAPADAERLPLPPGVRNRRSEYSVEIVLTLAFLHYWNGISFDNARQVMNFFTGLKLQKSQADSLLSQLADDWNEDYDAIAELIALQMIVYVDETGWKVGARSCYTWAFTTAGYVLFRRGVGRGKEEAKAVLGDCFPDVGVSDDYAGYRSLFAKHQLCWAHLLRKAIKLALQNPDNSIYARFLDEAEFRKGGRISKTQAKARRRSVIMTVFASLRTRLEAFTLSNVVAEIDRWISDGISILRAELTNASASPTAA